MTSTRVRADGYKVLFLTSNGSGFALHWYNGTTRANAASVTVTVGSTTTGIDAQLGP